MQGFAVASWQASEWSGGLAALRRLGRRMVCGGLMFGGERVAGLCPKGFKFACVPISCA